MVKKYFLGAPFPIVKHPRGYLHTQHGVDQIKSDLMILLLTNPGERIMLPMYGCPLRQFLFEINDAQTLLNIRQTIIDAITLWEPRVTIQQIEVTNTSDDFNLNPEDTGENNEHIVQIKILFFDPQDITEVKELKLQLPTGGGGINAG